MFIFAQTNWWAIVVNNAIVKNVSKIYDVKNERLQDFNGVATNSCF